MTKILNALKRESSIIENSKGGLYFATSWNANLDFFSMVGRCKSQIEIYTAFEQAFIEDKVMAVANLLYNLDIRKGKGEREIFKISFKYLCNEHPEVAVKILPLIPVLGRWDYVLCAVGTPVENDAILMIRNQLVEDMHSENPSLLAKWLPSLRTHNKDNPEAYHIAKSLGYAPKKYRKILSMLRSKLRIVEKQLSDQKYDQIDFSAVPTKAMLKYSEKFNRSCPHYGDYLDSLKKGEQKVNTKGLFCYEIVRKVMRDYCGKNADLLDAMWNSQTDFLKDNKTNVLVMADTSGSMLLHDGLPFYNSLGLAIYTAERNHGIFHNHFMTFSSRPEIQAIKGENIVQKVRSIRSIIENTDIDKAFKLLLDTARTYDIDKNEMPSHIIIISDMEFDNGVMSKGGTNFHGWKKVFEEAGYTLPKIVFWNVAGNPNGLPVTKFDNDVAMISGFNTSVFGSILDIENYNPVDIMMEVLAPYLEISSDIVTAQGQ